MNCKNCGHNLEGKYCIECGQNAKTTRINFKYIIEEIPNSIFQIDHGFFYTVKELFIRPGHSLREFMEGKRKNHFKPLAFLLLTSTIYVFVNYLLGYNKDFNDLIKISDAEGRFNTEIIDWLFDKQSYVLLFTVPFFSLATYLAFIKAKYNYFEHLVLNIYIVGQQTVINTLLIFGQNWEGIYSFLFTLPIVAFNIWTLIQFFKGISLARKVSLILLSYFIIFILIMLITTLAILLLYYYS